MIDADTLNALIEGKDNKWSDSTITYSFYEDDVFEGTYDGKETGVHEVEEQVKENVREIMRMLESIINVSFEEVDETEDETGDIRYMYSDGPDYAYSKPGYDSDSVDGDIHLSSDSTNFDTTAPGGKEFKTLIHETLHSLGLKHPGDYNGKKEGTPPFLDHALDNNTNTIMSYNHPGSFASSPMPYDIAALQHLYGANKTYNADDTVYLFDSVNGFYDGRYYWGSPTNRTNTNRTKVTIWDGGGTDTLDFSRLSTNTQGYRFNIFEGDGLLTTKEAYKNKSDYSGHYYDEIDKKVKLTNEKYSTTAFGTSIAEDVLIENVIGSSSDDDIFGNSADNKITGGQGNDSLSGGQGGDTLYGGQGNDSLSGSKGNDSLRGGSGKDQLWGGSGNDVLLGNSGDDVFQGGDGDDVLLGGIGNDTLTGGNNRDRFVFDLDRPFNSSDLGVDRITDFSVGPDKIRFSKDTFTALDNNSNGPLQNTDFEVVTSDASAESSSAEIIYNSSNGNLYYNPNNDALGFGDGGLFAVLDGSPELSASDFQVVDV